MNKITLGCFAYFPAMIQAVNLPSGSEINESFEGRTAVLSGFGVTSSGLYLKLAFE